MKMKPTTVMRWFKFWPPYLSSGISVKEFDLDKGYVISQMKQSKWNANAFGTLYGGNLYSMCDPFYVFILAHHLGKSYYIWDIEANIKFLKASRGPVFARFEINLEEIKKIKTEAQSGEKVTPIFQTQIIDGDKNIIAEVTKKLYVKRKK